MAGQVHACDVPIDVWQAHVAPAMTRADQAALRATCSYFAELALSQPGPTCSFCSGTGRLLTRHAAASGHTHCLHLMHLLCVGWWQPAKRATSPSSSDRQRDSPLSYKIWGSRVESILNGPMNETAEAARYGHLDTLVFLHDVLNCPLGGEEMFAAVFGNHAEIWDIEYIDMQRDNDYEAVGEMVAATMGGHCNRLSWLLEKYANDGDTFMSFAVKYGHADAVQLLYRHYFATTPTWLRDSRIRDGYPWDGDEGEVAAKHENVDVLLVLHKVGFPYPARN